MLLGDLGEGDHAHQRLKAKGPNVTTEEGRTVDAATTTMAQAMIRDILV
ncbi:hypothetical protein RAO22_03110 [Pediococcus acidilactici]